MHLFLHCKNWSPELLMQLPVLAIPAGMCWAFHSFYEGAELCKNHGKTCECVEPLALVCPLPGRCSVPSTHTRGEHNANAAASARLRTALALPCPALPGSISPPAPWSQPLAIRRISRATPPLAQHHLHDSNSSIAGFLLPSETLDNWCFYFYPGLVKGRCRTRSGVLGFPWPFCFIPQMLFAFDKQDSSSLLPGFDPWGAAQAQHMASPPALHFPYWLSSHRTGQSHSLQSKKHPELWKNLGISHQQCCGWITTVPAWLGCSWDEKSQGEFRISREISKFPPVAVI